MGKVLCRCLLVVLCLVFVVSCSGDPEHVHTFDDGKVTTEATCSATGVKIYTCTTCGQTKTETIPIDSNSHSFSSTYNSDATNHWKECANTGCTAKTENTGHVWNEGETTKEPTCTETGIKTYACTTCSQTKTETIPIDPNSHSFSSTYNSDETNHWKECSLCSAKKDEGAHTQATRTTATCTKDGIKTTYCSVCEKIISTENQGALGHEEINHEAKAATCTEKGWAAYVTCSRCDYTTYSEIKATGHSFNTNTWSSDNEYHWHPATCGHTSEKDALEVHKWNEGVVTTEASCVAEGVKTITCTTCQKTKTEAIDMLEHTYEEAWIYDSTYHWHKCSNSECTAEGSKAEHVWDSYTVTEPATETTPGKGTYTCVCGETNVVKIPAKGNWNSDDDKHWHGTGSEKTDEANHEWSAAIITKAATCTATGEQKQTCTVCGKVKTETISALTHKMETVKAQEPTCTQKGWSAYQMCSLCGVKTNYSEKKALGHVFSSTYTTDENGHWKVCTRTGCTEKSEIAVHTMVAGETTATCTEAGIVPYTCTCGYKTEKEVEALGHNYTGNWISLDSKGHSQRCSRCQEFGPTSEHTCVKDEETSKDATCSEEGRITYNCSVTGCNYEYSTGIGKLDHVWDEGTVTKEATCTKDGVKTYNCKNCSETKKETIKASHNYENYKCTKCELWQEGPSGGYVFYDCDADNTTENGAVTAGPDGLMSSVCGWRFLEAAPSDVGGWVYFYFYRLDGTNKQAVEPVDETAVNVAIGTGYTNTIALVGAMGSTAYTTEKGTETTDTYAAKVAYSYSCPALSSSVDNDWFLPSSAELDLMYSNLKKKQLGSFEDARYLSSTECSTITVITQDFYLGEQNNYTKKTGGYVRPIRAFSVCTDSVNHTWVETGSTSVSCETGGSKSYKCTVCGGTKTLQIPKVEHNYQTVEAKEPTCTEIGWNEYKECTKCGFRDGYTELEAKGHTNSNTRDNDETYHWFKCSVCGGKCSTPVEHTYGAWSTVTEATCTTDGKQTHGCIYCGYTEEQNLPATGHNWEYTSDTCTETGHWQICSKCKATTEKEEHTLELDEVVSESTCAKTGTKLMKCVKCTRKYYVSTPKLEHVFKEEWESADFWHWHACTNEDCTERGSLSTHNWNDGEITTPATCSTYGVKTYTCKDCGNKSKTETISWDENNHIFDTTTWKSNATSHWHKAKCTHNVCGDEAPHAWKTEIITAVTCTKDGQTAYTCTVCGYEKTETIPATGVHTYVDYKCKDCDIWTKGPTGGYVFYDCDSDNITENGVVTAGLDGLMSSVCGWRFLEAAPADLDKTYIFGYYKKSGSEAVYTAETETGIGTGKSNTEKLVKAMEETAYTGVDSTTTVEEYAAKACDEYSLPVNGKTYSDWFLPSKDELYLMYTNLEENKLDSFLYNSYYWSSSEKTDSLAWNQDFGNGKQENYNVRSYSLSVRPIRAFTDTETATSN